MAAQTGIVWGRGLAGFALLAASMGGRAWASGPDETVPTAALVQTLEQKADAAALRDQCFLYTDLLHRLTEMEGQQMSTGENAAAASTLAQMERIAAKMKAAETKDAKRLKNAEELMEHTTHRLGDMMHLASDDERTAMKSTLEHLNKLHEDMLVLVFAK